MNAAFRYSLCLTLLSASLVLAGTEGYKLKSAKKAAPGDLEDSIEKLMSDQALELHKDGKLVAEIWFCKAVPAKVSADKAAKGVTYRDLPESTIFGTVRFHTNWGDYRKQKIKPGVYTMRLAFQPQDGDHMGTARYPEFMLLLAAKYDPKLAGYGYKEMVERSMASINTAHPAVFMLFPGKEVKEKASLVKMMDDHQVLQTRVPVTVEGGKEASVGVALTIVGHAAE